MNGFSCEEYDQSKVNMTDQTNFPKGNLITNVLLGVIIVLLVILIALFATTQARNASQASAETASEAVAREALVNKIAQMSKENQVAIDDLYNDYIRDRGYLTEEETDYLLKRGLVGDEYIVHGILFLAKQNNQILEMLAELQ